VDGLNGEQANFSLGDMETPPFDQRVWLIIESSKLEHPGAEGELVVLNEHGAIQQRVRGIRRIRVSRRENEQSPQREVSTR
jgi:hypothetical protein